jgi:hypothetical protein
MGMIPTLLFINLFPLQLENAVEPFEPERVHPECHDGPDAINRSSYDDACLRTIKRLSFKTMVFDHQNLRYLFSHIVFFHLVEKNRVAIPRGMATLWELRLVSVQNNFLAFIGRAHPTFRFGWDGKLQSTSPSGKVE